MEFASKEYLKEVMERSNVDEKYLELAKGEDASYTFMIQAEPKKGVEKDIVLGYKVDACMHACMGISCVLTNAKVAEAQSLKHL